MEQYKAYFAEGARNRLQKEIDKMVEVVEGRQQRKISYDELRGFAAHAIANMDKTVFDLEGISTEGWVDLMYPPIEEHSDVPQRIIPLKRADPPQRTVPPGPPDLWHHLLPWEEDYKRYWQRPFPEGRQQFVLVQYNSGSREFKTSQLAKGREFVNYSELCSYYADNVALLNHDTKHLGLGLDEDDMDFSYTARDIMKYLRQQATTKDMIVGAKKNIHQWLNEVIPGALQPVHANS